MLSIKNEMTSPLIRYKSESLIDFSPENIIFIGNGIFENGWDPLALAVKESNPFFNSATNWNKHELAHVLSLASYRYRSIRSYFLNTAISEEKFEINDPKGFSSFLARFLDFRKNIALKYQTIALKLRPFPSEIERIIFDENTAIITTNWDETLWKLKISNIIQLHGRSEYPDSLILPTEFSDEDSLPFQLVMNGRKDYEWLWRQFYRGPLSHELFNAHLTASRWLSRAKNIYIWGLAFHEYDAELNHLFATVSKSSSVKPIKVFDDPSDQMKSKCIEDRVIKLLSTFIIKQSPDLFYLAPRKQ